MKIFNNRIKHKFNSNPNNNNYNKCKYNKN